MPTKKAFFVFFGNKEDCTELQPALFLSASRTLYGGMRYCYSTFPSSPLHKGSGLWWGMSSIKPGWLCGSSLDNARGFFVCVIEDGWAVFDVIPVPIVCSTSVLGLRGVGFGFGVEVSGAVLGMGGLVFRVFWGIGGFSRWFYQIHQLWHGIGGWGVFHQQVIGHCIVSICPFWRGHKVCVVRAIPWA